MSVVWSPATTSTRASTLLRLAWVAAAAVVALAVGGAAVSVGSAAAPASAPAIVMLLLLGLALLASLARRARWSAVLSLPALVVCIGVLGMFVADGGQLLAQLLPGLAALPINTAAGLLCASLGVVLSAWSARRDVSQLAIVVLAATAAAIGAFGLFGRLSGIAPGVGWALVSSVSSLSGVGLVLCGACLVLQRTADSELPGGRSMGDHSGVLAAFTVLGIALAATAVSWRASVDTAVAQQEQAFAAVVRQLAAAITSRLHSYVDVLRGTQGLFAASEFVDADEWRRYFDQIDLGSRFPGIDAAGYAPHIKAAELATYEQQMQSRIRADFRVWPQAERSDYFPVTYVEPMQGHNLTVVGFDLGSESLRRDAIERALGSDQANLSGVLALLPRQGAVAEPGFYLFLPLRGGRHDEDPHRNNVGVAYVVFRARDWMASIGAEYRDGIRIELYDSEGERTPSRLLYADAPPAPAAAPLFTREQTIAVAGRRWTLYAQALPTFLAAHRTHAPLWVLLGGLVCSLLLFLIVWLLAGARTRALNMAEHMTAELRRSQRAFQALSDTANDAIVSADAKGCIRYVNQATRRCFGHADDALLGQDLTVLMPERYRSAHNEGMARYLAGGEPRVVGRTVELAGVRGDGTEFPIEISIACWEGDGEPNFTAIIRDISERKQGERALELQRVELQRSNADLEQFAYVASHDLQEPLRMVASYVQLLSRRYKGKLDSDADEFIGFAVDGAMRMQQLIGDLLAYSRVTARSEVSAHVICAETVAAAMRNLSVRIRDSGADIQVDSLPVLRADPAQLTQLFQNLIGNALKFSGNKRPVVRISAARVDARWEFRVSDNGIGIDPQYADRIFIIFQRLHTRQQFAGTGIGLAICKKIVERAGGRIWVESRLGEGATFCFTWPDTEHSP